ncbi:MGT2 magnesium transporter [Trypanosoma grayi]|uniref:MGT2 magnesium transporter n=1 Tax=Trypanosoma grayi TaxID=71804 RepID=UPI0004F48C6C|nr:MGT2 magnesium transporter [Trypanosoma grayi]KEG09082.1 MGT2 magnesium transporter [Trypanosoma grayi]
MQDDSGAAVLSDTRQPSQPATYPLTVGAECVPVSEAAPASLLPSLPVKAHAGGAHMGDLRSEQDHLWLIYHEVGTSARMKRFRTVVEFAKYTQELMNTEPTVITTATTAAATASSTQEQEEKQLPREGEGMHGGIQLPVQRGSLPHGRMRERRRRRSREPNTPSGSSSSSSSSDTPLTRSYWLDIQSSNEEVIRDALRLFPIHSTTVEAVLNPESFDSAETYSSLDYVFLNLACNRLSTSAKPFETFGGAVYDTMGENIALCGVLCFEDWVVTVHSAPFGGLLETVQKIQRRHGLRRHHAGGQTSAVLVAAAAETAAAAAAVPAVIAGAKSYAPLRAAWVLATLVDFVTETFVPDPASVLAQVDALDEMVLHISDEQDQPDLLRRVALLRRRISTQRTLLYRKERLVRQLLMPLMRTSFVAQDDDIADLYKHTLVSVVHVAERLDNARDLLNHSNMNFVAMVSMRMSQDSARMDVKMQVLTQVATICLPLSLVASIFGMNVTVPWEQTGELNAFWGIIGFMVLWLVVCLIPTLMNLRKHIRRTPISDG